MSASPKSRRARASSLFVCAALAVGATSASRDARAQSSEDKAAAQAAFDVGKRLMVDGKFDQACPKFAESNRLDPGIGTMLFLADCYERTGRTASAWSEFREAEALATKQNDGREKLAHDRGDALESKLLKVVVNVPAAVASTSGLKVTRDGQEVGQGLWGVPVPIDPGPHEIRASAPGKKEWSTKVEIAPGEPLTQVAIPELADGPPEAAGGLDGAAGHGGEATGGGSGSTQRVAGAAVAGLGVVGIAVGAVFGLSAKSKLDDSNAAGVCRADNHCTSAGAQLRSDAKSAATLSTIGFVAGGVLLAGGAVLFFTAPQSKRPVSVGASFVPGAGGAFRVDGRF